MKKMWTNSIISFFLAEQHEIVRCVNALFARPDAIEREVAAATKRAEALTQSALARAFTGIL